jgi:hypothetical protein
MKTLRQTAEMAALRRAVVQLGEKAGRAARVSVNAEGAAVSTQGNITVVCVPLAAMARWNVAYVMRASSQRANRQIMLYVLGGEFFTRKRRRLSAGVYRVVADFRRGKAILATLGGRRVGEGAMQVCQSSTPPVLARGAKTKVTGDVDSVDVNAFPPSIKVCGHVTIKNGNQTITISGCIEAGF